MPDPLDQKKSSRTYPSLEVVAGPDEGLIIPLQPGEQILGRSADLAICLADTSISRTHAQIIVEGEKISIQDLASRNGVYVNGIRVKQFEPTPLAHRAEIRIGIYLLRLALSPLQEEQNASAKNTFVSEPSTTGPSTTGTSATGPSTTSELQTDPALSEKLLATSKKTEAPLSDEKIEESDIPINQSPPSFTSVPEGTRLTIVFFVIGLASVLCGLYYFYTHSHKPSPGVTAPLEKPIAPLPVPPKPEEPPTPPAIVLPAQPTNSTNVSSLHRFNTFLDISSTPTTARISLDGKDLGQSNLKISISVETDKEYTVTAEFDLRDVHDKYQQKLTFKADPRKEVVPLVFDAELGTIKIMKLPRNVSFQLTGFYAYDKTKAHPVVLTDIIYGKPVYVPFGNYVIELREKTQMGSSNTYVDEIRYHREFEINAEHRLLELSMTDRDLQFYPAQLQSIPSHADIYIDGSKVGSTPFNGDLPLGRHEIKLTHEGYFDTLDTLDMQTNTSYTASFTLKTSKVGEFINKAKDYQRSGQYQQAIDQLVEALKLDGTDAEKEEIHFLLGDNFYRLSNYEEAKNYFDQVKDTPDFHSRALLGLAKIFYAQGDQNTSLTRLVEVLVNTNNDGTLQNEANALFQKISPIKSVIYIHTEPAGATVVVNKLPVDQTTPLILSDLSLGIYRIEIQKNGFQDQQIKKELKLGEFTPIFVKLVPDKF